MSRTTVFDVAAYILDAQGSMSTMKLQKLVFYSAAYCAAWHDRRLFDEPIQAWVNGPVVYPLFKAHQGEYAVTSGDIEGDPAKLSREDENVVRAVLKGLGGLSGVELRERTHEEDPWINAFDDGDARHQNSITFEAMRDYYREHG